MKNKKPITSTSVISLWNLSSNNCLSLKPLRKYCCSIPKETTSLLSKEHKKLCMNTCAKVNNFMPINLNLGRL